MKNWLKHLFRPRKPARTLTTEDATAEALRVFPRCC